MHNFIFRTLNMAMGIGCAMIFMAMVPNATFVNIMIGLMASMFISNVLHTVMHEAGHLVFGLMSGYKFLSFRVGSHVWVNLDGKITHKRFTLAGTAGQCLLVPPMMQDGKLPFKLYLWGGCIMNSLLALVFVAISLLTTNAYVDAACYILAYVGFIMTLQNGLPLKLPHVDNDGYTIDCISDNKAALYGFWLQMMVNAQLTKGIRLKDMPEEWFEVDTYNLDNHMASSAIYYKVIRLMDMHAFDEVEYEVENALNRSVAFAGVHKYMLICELLYCKALKQQSVDYYLTADVKQFMQMMRNNITVLRTQYVLTKQEEHKKRFLQMFEAIGKVHPYAAEVNSERELIALYNEKMEEYKQQELEDTI